LWSYQAKTEDSKKAFFDLAHTWAWAALHPEASWIRQDGAQAASVDGFVLRRIKATAWVASLIQATEPICHQWQVADKLANTIDRSSRLHKNYSPGAIRVECRQCPLEVPLAQGKGIGHKSIDSSGGVSTGDRGNSYASEKIAADEENRIFVIS
jgi:hypothetical protein